MNDKVLYYVAYTLAPKHFDEDESGIKTKKVKIECPAIVTPGKIKEILQKDSIDKIGTIIAFSRIEAI